MASDTQTKSDKPKCLSNTACTGIYGMFTQGRCYGRYSSLSEANTSAARWFKSIKGKDIGSDVIDSDSPFDAFCTTGNGSGTRRIRVEELELEKCQMPELKRIAKREGVSISGCLKKQILTRLQPYIAHKKHQQRGEEKDFKGCAMCKNYDAVIRAKAFKNMFRQSMMCSIKERDVKVRRMLLKM